MLKTVKMYLFLITSLVCLPGIVLGDAIDSDNNPQAMRIEGQAWYDTNVDRLMERFPVGQKFKTGNYPGWSDDYYATYQGGICHPFVGEFDPSAEEQAADETRAQFRSRVAKLEALIGGVDKLDNLTAFNGHDIKYMSQKNLDRLPPAMLMDLKKGRVYSDGTYEYTLTQYELDRTRDVRLQYAALDKEEKALFEEMEDAAGDEKARLESQVEKVREKKSKINWFGICHG